MMHWAVLMFDTNEIIEIIDHNTVFPGTTGASEHDQLADEDRPRFRPVFVPRPGTGAYARSADASVVRVSSRQREEVDLSAVLAALDDEDCRALLLAADRPRSAQELAERADVPQSTTYRKVDLLREAKLVEERTEIRADGKHTSTYRTDFDAVRVALDGFERFEVEIERPDRSPERQFADLWREVRKET